MKPTTLATRLCLSCGWGRTAVFKQGLMALAALSLVLNGCASPQSGVTRVSGVPDQEQPVEEKVVGAELPQGQLGFRIAPMDTLQVDVYPHWSSESERKAEYATEVHLELAFHDRLYRITHRDLIRIELPDESNKYNDLPVLPNGTVRLPRINTEVQAAGLTPAELALTVNHKYQVMFNRPKVVVNIQESGLNDLSKISGAYTVDRDGRLVIPKLGAIPVLGKPSKEIAAAVAEVASREYSNRIEVSASFSPISGKANDQRLAPDGQQYFHGSIKVSPEGTIFVPEVGSFRVAGQTLDELAMTMRQSFRKVYQNPVDVSVNLQESANLTVFIGGEVRTPGRYPVQSAQTVLQLLTDAGWVTDSADIEQVMLLHAVSEKEYVLYKTNLAEVLSGKATAGQDMKLSPRDIVVVPKSGIAKADLWVDQYLRRILPFGTNFGYVIQRGGN